MKASQKVPASVFVRACPSRLLLGKLANKWSLLIIDALANKRRRNGELLRMIEGISQKMLTQSLRELEEMALVRRHDLQTVPPHVEYELTDLGRSLRKEVARLDRWLEDNMQEITCALSGQRQCI
ncbi:MAG: helix-turn-helix domain-containing protein [Pseudomonadota bacterium]